jgi:signal transduction histidine kinase
MDILQKEYLGPLNERQKKQLSVAAHHRELIRESLVDLRELERLMVLRMQGTWQMAPFGLNEIVDDAIATFEPRAKAQNLILTKEAGPMLQALGEARAIRRVIDNLIVNALKFTPAGGRVHLRLYQKADNLFIDVVDTGPGIPDSELPRIFDPFYRASKNTSVPRGTGLGLSVVKEVVAIHKGRIHVNSILGTGTTFTIELPSILRLNEFQQTPSSSAGAGNKD